MISSGICPTCKKVVLTAKLETIPITAVGIVPLPGVSLVCPNCQTILGVSIDPIALKTEIVAEITRLLSLKVP